MNRFLSSNKLFFLFITLIVIGIFSSCSNDDKGYQQYYNPMGNNPLFVLPWMKNVVKSYYKEQAVILQYEYQDEIYYMAKAFLPPDTLNGLAIVQCTIYENNQNEANVFFESDNINDLNNPKNELYFKFLNESVFKYLLWKNTPKDDSLMIPWEFE